MRRVSDWLRDEREEKGLALEEIEQATKIKKEYLVAIEEGKYQKLPSYTYALGFVKNYASFLDLPEKTVTAFFRREYARETLEIVPEFRKNQHTFTKNFFFRPTGIFTLLTIFIILSYIAFQYGSFFFGPKLSILAPKNGAVINKSVIEVTGKTDQYATVLIDEDEAYVEIDGTFKKSVYAFTGEKTIIVIARNRFGKETKETISVKVQ